jgi:flagellar protein FliO/FliZ
MISDWGLLARFLLALAVVLALIAAATWLARRYLGSAMMAGLSGRRRLAVSESIMLDGKSRLFLVRRDNIEHLLVLGPAGSAVVESGIPAPAASAGPPAAPATRTTADAP